MTIQTLLPNEAHALLSSGAAVLIDVREADEFAQGHIPYALSIPLSSLEKGFACLDIPQDKKIIFQCLKGSRGEQACTLVKGSMVCANEIYNIEGGITAWTEAGLPLVSKSAPGISIFRQVQIIVGGLVALLVLFGLNLGATVPLAIAGLLGGALFAAGVTGWCGLAMVLSKMPWNNPQAQKKSCCQSKSSCCGHSVT